jgi:hypothetical protein
MAATEPSVIGGIMTFFALGVLPLSLVLYLGGVRFRRRPLPPPDAADEERTPES